MAHATDSTHNGNGTTDGERRRMFRDLRERTERRHRQRQRLIERLIAQSRERRSRALRQRSR